MWQGHEVAAPVVYDHETGAPFRTLPARSVPVTDTEYDAFGVSALFGVNVAVFVFPLYVSVAGTVWFDASFNVMASDETFIASLNVTVTGSPTDTPVAPEAGVCPVMLGG